MGVTINGRTRGSGGGSGTSTGGLTQTQTDARVRAIALLRTLSESVANATQLGALTTGGSVAFARITATFTSSGTTYTNGEIWFYDSEDSAWELLFSPGGATVVTGISLSGTTVSLSRSGSAADLTLDLKLLPGNTIWVGEDEVSGTDDIVLTISGYGSSFGGGDRFVFKFENTNTGAMTLGINSITAVDLVRKDGTAFKAGDVQDEMLVEVTYDSDDGRFVSDILPATATTTTSSDAIGDEIARTAELPGSGQREVYTTAWTLASGVASGVSTSDGILRLPLLRPTNNTRGLILLAYSGTTKRGEVVFDFGAESVDGDNEYASFNAKPIAWENGRYVWVDYYLDTTDGPSIRLIGSGLGLVSATVRAHWLVG